MGDSSSYQLFLLPCADGQTTLVPQLRGNAWGNERKRTDMKHHAASRQRCWSRSVAIVVWCNQFLGIRPSRSTSDISVKHFWWCGLLGRLLGRLVSPHGFLGDPIRRVAGHQWLGVPFLTFYLAIVLYTKYEQRWKPWRMVKLGL